MLDQEAIQEFKEIYKDEFGVELSSEQGKELATKFLLLFKAIYKPIPKEKVDNVKSNLQ